MNSQTQKSPQNPNREKKYQKMQNSKDKENILKVVKNKDRSSKINIEIEDNLLIRTTEPDVNGKIASIC